MKRNIVITIERQYGSGGRTVGEMLAKDLGIHYYNKELTKLAAEESGINEELFVKADENVSRRNPLVVAVRKSMYTDGELKGPDSPDYTSMENLFRLQAAAIQKLAETSSCVIVGRAANYILKDYIEDTDRRKADYYYYYTGEYWDSVKGYDLCLNSAKLGFEKCVQEIEASLKVRFGDDILD